MQTKRITTTQQPIKPPLVFIMLFAEGLNNRDMYYILWRSYYRFRFILRHTSEDHHELYNTSHSPKYPNIPLIYLWNIIQSCAEVNMNFTVRVNNVNTLLLSLTQQIDINIHVISAAAPAAFKTLWHLYMAKWKLMHEAGCGRCNGTQVNYQKQRESEGWRFYTHRAGWPLQNRITST